AFAASLLSACETTNLARNSTPPATIRQEFVLHSMTQDWEGTYLYGVGLTDLGFGHLGDRKGLTLTVDSGLSTIRFFYLSHRHGDDNLFHQTDVIYMEVNLRPNGKYTLHCDASDETARFTLIELSTKEAAATSVDVPLYIRPSPERSGPGFMPMFIPGHH
ncbi:MAG TPA: hypothetical protein VKG63_06490, partial [Steroidobacteraceae bacterium]|nr:hypothetical protein [Steroidobacteraceae bacterium]